MSPHKFTTPRVVYLGQAYGGREDREARNEAQLPRATDRSASVRAVAHRAVPAARASAR
ncbi:MAG TPA: hypothetical protein VG321_04755 [Solirubrobacteraceae bacterium]|nr:hypothetical protein [Solirubrobacteraceae bacterium]